MKLRFLVSVSSLILVVLLVFWQRETRPSPGPLSAVHERDSRIEEQDCELCHDAQRNSFAPCAECHGEIQRSIAAKKGLHGRLREPEDCGRCHGEHRGPGAGLVTEAAFERSGYAGREGYKHEGLRFGLSGAHEKLDCAQCHKLSGLPLLPVGKKRFLGLRQDCAGCHDDPHKGKQGEDCASCHGQERPFEQVATFEHTADFPLVEGHAGLACSKCHDNLRDRSSEEIRKETGHACADCHQDPHAAGGKGLQFETKKDCALCHGTKSFEEPLLGTKDHAKFGSELKGVHREQDCAECHEGGKRESISQRMRWVAADLKPQVLSDAWVPKDPGDCAVCHLAPHTKAFLAGQGMGAPVASCAGCHEAAARRFGRPEARMNLEIHAKGGVPLEGAHRELDCERCHKEAGTRPSGSDPKAVFAAFRKRFPGRDMKGCKVCHEDVHAGDFDKGPFEGQECSACHSDAHFSPSLFDTETHARTSFALTGAHEALACTACHKELRVSGTQKVRRFGGLEGRCLGCHRDPHGDRLVRPLGAGARDPKNCQNCHDTTHFQPPKKGAFDHGRDTRFALLGAHKAAACERCHAPATKAGDGSLVRESPPQTCEACHDDPHLGQFRRTGRNDCLNCHSQDKFKPVHFDHEKDSRFALGKNHARVACAACHQPTRLKSGERVILYRPLPRTCKGCHGLPGKGGK